MHDGKTEEVPLAFVDKSISTKLEEKFCWMFSVKLNGAKCCPTKHAQAQKMVVAGI